MMEIVRVDPEKEAQKKADNDYIDRIKEIIDKQPPDSYINETFEWLLKEAQDEQVRRATEQPPEPFLSLEEIFDSVLKDPNLYKDPTGKGKDYQLESQAMSRIIDAQAEINERREEAGVDQLTQVYNRRKVLKILDDRLPDPPEEGRRTVTTKEEKRLYPFAIALFDIDHFKQINDVYGHMVGDEVLVAMARFLTENLRTEHDEDVVARWGGEEFLVLISAPANRVDTILHDLQKNLRKTILVHHEGKDIPVRVSIGWTMYDPAQAAHDAEFKRDLTPPSLIDEADKALYVVKEHGRDGVWRNL